MGEKDRVQDELREAQREHAQLEIKIAALLEQAGVDQLLVQRLKKRKLWLKDRIRELEDFLFDDIIA